MRKRSPLRNVRRARTLSQEQMARLLDVSQQTYSKYESGRLVPPVDVQARISAILGSSADALFGGVAGNVGNDSTVHEAKAS